MGRSVRAKKQAEMTPEQAREILAERQAADPIWQWFNGGLIKKTQLLFFKSQALYTLITSGNRTGKTTAAIIHCASTARGKNPYKKWYGPVRLMVIVPKRAQAAGIWGRRMLSGSNIRVTVTTPGGKHIDLSRQPLIPADEIDQLVWSYSPAGKFPGYLRLKNGSEIYTFLSDNPKAFEKVQGFDFDGVYRDEANGNDELGDEILGRISDAQSDPLRPGAGYIVWTATATLENTEFYEYKKRCEEGAFQHELFCIPPDESPIVTKEVRENMRALMSPEAAAIRLDGTGTFRDTILVFREQWNTERHVLKEDYVPGPLDSLWIAWDPGWDHAFGLLCCAIRPELPYTINVVRYYGDRHKTLDYVANCMAEWLDGRFLEALVCDPNAKRTEHSRGKSMAFQMEQLLSQMHVNMKRGIIYGRNIYTDTIPMMQRWLDPDPGNRLAQPRFVVNPTSPGCGMVIEQIMKYRLKKKATDARNHYNIHGKDTEAVDCARYLISREPVWTEREPNVARSIPFRLANATPQPPPRKTDPLADEPGLSDEMRVHRQRLRESSRMVGSMQGHTLPRMGTGRLNW